MPSINRITPCLWFDSEGEEAAAFYTSIFPNSKIGNIARYTEVGREFHHKEPGSAMVVSFELDGQPFTALNGGPVFTFSEAISFQINCKDQDEVDHYWNRLSEGGDPAAQQCGWLKDRFGVSWQVIPDALIELMSSPDPEVVSRVSAAMFQMKKIVIADLRRAASE